MVQFNKNLLTVVLLFLTLLSGSCGKEDAMADSPSLDSQNFAGIAAFNGIEGTGNLQLLVDDKVVNKTDENFQSGGYLSTRTIFPGVRRLVLSSSKGHVYVKRDLEIAPAKFYSIFFYDKDSPETVVAEDDVIKPENGNLKVRLVNLVSDGKIKLEYTYKNSGVTEDFKERITEYKNYSSKEGVNFKVSSTDGKYQSMEIPFKGIDRSINTVIIYPELNKESSKSELKFKILEIK